MSAYTGSVPDTRRRKPDWRTFAACRADGVDPDAMFPDSDKVRTAKARAICAACPVSRTCLKDAINSGENQWGIRGGLTPEERRAVKRELNRRKRAAEARQEDAEQAVLARAARAAERKTYATFRELFDDNTTRLITGHLAWTGPDKPYFKGRAYNPKQIAFIVDRGRQPVGRTLATCGVSSCVLPAHVADDEERIRCGTRSGYQRHLKNHTRPCDACREANTDADNRLRRTGTTKAAA